MKRISSRWTFFYKRLFPIFWFGVVAVVFVAALFSGPDKRGHSAPAFFAIMPAIMGGVGFIMFRKLIWTLADEVWDCDDGALLVKTSSREERIELSNVINVGWSSFSNPPRVTLTLRAPGATGRDVAFMTPARVFNFGKDPIVDDLIQRVDAARQLRRENA
jgi:hypothetical protein